MRRTASRFGIYLGRGPRHLGVPGPDVYSDEDAMMKFTAPPDSESEC